MAFLRILSSRRSPLAALARPMSAAATSTKSTVGFIGLGQMGARMAENLRLKGHQLVVSDPVAANLAPLADKGAVVAGSPKEVAALADTVITMLPSTDVVRHVFLGEGGIHEALRPEHVLIDSSTIDPLGAKHVSDEIHARGATFVDAPVSGGVMGAQNATLTFMVGGTPAEFERVKSLLADMGRNIVHCGGSCAFVV
jgi:3-hydroxyisobutyrate dehydrogenase-like beta-hydroxyacid dehydrogenase